MAGADSSNPHGNQSNGDSQPRDQTISQAGGIPSGEAFGIPTVHPPPIRIEVHAIASLEAVGELTLWKYGTLAPEWFKDAVSEAKKANDQAARRREIVFAVCVAESYLFEWVRDQILAQDFKSLNEFLPPDDRRGIRERWKEVIANLKKQGKIKRQPAWGQRFWMEFSRLVEMRNGLAHARASRPSTDGLGDKEQPFPTLDELQRLPAGWATRTVITVIREVHQAVGTPPPAWLIDP
jgi:hypothetical protein